MKTQRILILGLLGGLLGAVTIPAQALPSSWNRSKDWVPKKNPSPDSKGNIMWHALHRRGFATLATEWSTVWDGWVYGFSRWVGSAPITQYALFHLTANPNRYPITPEIWFINTTKQSFLLKIDGSLRVGWLAGAKPAPSDVKVEIQFFDSSRGMQTTNLFSKTVSKPSGATTTFSVNIPTLRMDPGDVIRYAFRALTPNNPGSQVTLVDNGLNFVRKNTALATETVRNATPKNPLTLNKGRTTRPIIGKTWDPYLTSVPTGATGILLAIGVTQLHVRLPFGTLLTDPLLVLPGKVGSDFGIAIPNNVALAGVRASLQGASITSAGGLLLSNALDIRVGDF